MQAVQYLWTRPDLMIGYATMLSFFVCTFFYFRDLNKSVKAMTKTKLSLATKLSGLITISLLVIEVILYLNLIEVIAFILVGFIGLKLVQLMHWLEKKYPSY